MRLQKMVHSLLLEMQVEFALNLREACVFIPVLDVRDVKSYYRLVPYLSHSSYLENSMWLKYGFWKNGVAMRVFGKNVKISVL